MLGFSEVSCEKWVNLNTICKTRSMGTVKPAYIKVIATELLKRYPEVFTSNFEENKKIVSQLTTIKSKTIRNRVAGYITRKVNRQIKG